MSDPERQRLSSPLWRRWGPYLAERAWGTVREDYSANGDAWQSFPHDHARWRTYRWNEDGLGGFCDDRQRLCMAVALWNHRDPILKERLFGLSNPEGNHGEDVKELYFYTDATPSASYATMRYLYPIEPFPYEALVEGNRRRSRTEPELEIEDTGVFDHGYFDVELTYAKASPDQLVLRVEVTNRGEVAAPLTVVPTIWFRNTWSWGYERGPRGETPERPSLRAESDVITAEFDGEHFSWHTPDATEVVFTENETNPAGFGQPAPGYFKDAFHRYLTDGDADAVNPGLTGTKAGAVHRLLVEAGATVALETLLAPSDAVAPADWTAVVAQRRADANAFYAAFGPIDRERASVRRQAYAGLVWTKQLYYFDVGQWLDGDPAGPPPPPDRGRIRNADWRHIRNFDVLSMPDAWEYPWYATWDLAFHCVPFADLDADFAKANLELVTGDRYLHPNGQLPAYEWDFGNVNPPVMAWAARKVYEADRLRRGEGDRRWLGNLFYLLSLNYTWWQNRKDVDGNNIFQGGFLGLDNISIFDRSALPLGGHIDQSDGTAWMAFYTLGLLKMALLLAEGDSRYETLAMRFLRHFDQIAAAMNLDEHCLWDPESGFFFDVLHLPDGSFHQLRVKSMVGLLPLVAVEIVDEESTGALRAFSRLVAEYEAGAGRTMAARTRVRQGRRLLSVLDETQLQTVLKVLLDPEEFLSPFGIRSMARSHSAPYIFAADGLTYTVAYEPGESSSGLFGGNSNWRGPIWLPLNYLIIEALREYHAFYGDTFTVEFPTGSGAYLTLGAVADHLAHRLTSLFAMNNGVRPVYGGSTFFDSRSDPLLMFHEYFDAETGRGLGASHQTGWTALIAKLL